MCVFLDRLAGGFDDLVEPLRSNDALDRKEGEPNYAICMQSLSDLTVNK